MLHGTTLRHSRLFSLPRLLLLRLRYLLGPTCRRDGSQPPPPALQPFPGSPRRRSPYRDAVLEGDALQRVPGAEPVLHVALGQRRRHAGRAAVRAGLGVGQPLRQLGLALRPARRLLPQRLGHALTAHSATAAPRRFRSRRRVPGHGAARRSRPLRHRPPGGGTAAAAPAPAPARRGPARSRPRRACAAAVPTGGPRPRLRSAGGAGRGGACGSGPGASR